MTGRWSKPNQDTREVPQPTIAERQDGRIARGLVPRARTLTADSSRMERAKFLSINLWRGFRGDVEVRAGGSSLMICNDTGIETTHRGASRQAGGVNGGKDIRTRLRGGNTTRMASRGRMGPGPTMLNRAMQSRFKSGPRPKFPAGSEPCRVSRLRRGGPGGVDAVRQMKPEGPCGASPQPRQRGEIGEEHGESIPDNHSPAFGRVRWLWHR